jgi:uric acid-xanthine permease
MYADGTCSSTTAADGTTTRSACPDAYGKLLGIRSSYMLLPP